jgi:hypothetical protein
VAAVVVAAVGPRLASPAAAAARGRASSTCFTSGGGSEGSGLIDIRAMAAMTLGAGSKASSGPSMTASEDDLPVFSANAFAAPTAGVLLPTVQPEQKSNKPLYIIVGVLGAVVIGLVIFLIFGMGGKKVVVMNTPGPTQPGNNDTTTSAGPATPSTNPSITPPPGGTGTNPPGDTPPPGGTGTNPSVAPPPVGPTPTADKTDKPKDKTDKPKDKTDKPKDRVEKTTTDTPPPPTNTKVKCDEVACLVDNTLPCCKKGGSSTPDRGGDDDSSLPSSLTQSDIQSGLRPVNGRVQACNSQYKVPGMLKVKISINGDGQVTNAVAQGTFAGTPSGSCAEKALKSAKFKKWKGPNVNVTIPYTFR